MVAGPDPGHQFQGHPDSTAHFWALSCKCSLASQVQKPYGNKGFLQDTCNAGLVGYSSFWKTSGMTNASSCQVRSVPIHLSVPLSLPDNYMVFNNTAFVRCLQNDVDSRMKATASTHSHINTHTGYLLRHAYYYLFLYFKKLQQQNWARKACYYLLQQRLPCYPVSAWLV